MPYSTNTSKETIEQVRLATIAGELLELTLQVGYLLVAPGDPGVGDDGWRVE